MIQPYITQSFISGVNLITVYEAQYLSQVINELPSGIVDKSHPGVGGTTLELRCQRDSIIVVPYVVTASNKAKQSKDYFYYGYSDLQEKERITTQSKRERLDAFLKDYVSQMRDEKKHLKIICINDHLKPLKLALHRIEVPLVNFHLLFDEIDSMQDQSSFRYSMEESIDILNEHPDEKKTLLSATIADFSDPKISKLPRTLFLFENRQKQELTIRPSYYILDELLKSIKTFLHNDPDAKVLVAVNDVSICADLLLMLPQKVIGLQAEDVAVMCSANNQAAFPKNYYRLPETGQLAQKVNLITSVTLPLS